MKRFLYILNIVMIMFLLTGCDNSKNGREELQKKINSEISYIDSELVSIANELSNISYTNYKVDVEEIPNMSTNDEAPKAENSQNEQDSEKKNNKESGETQSSGNENQNSESSNLNYSMRPNNILDEKEEINWDELKSKIERLCSTWTTVSIDLKEVGVTPEDLITFSNNIDVLTIAIKNEDKIATMEGLINLYEFLPRYEATCGADKEKNVVYSKYNLLVCYKYMMLEDWEQLQNSISNLRISFSNILNKKDEYEGKSINIDSANVIIKEMENTSEIREKDVFLIKYKNLMQELNTIL